MAQNKSRNLLSYLRKLKEATSELRGIPIRKEGYSQILSSEDYERPEIEGIVFDGGVDANLINSQSKHPDKQRIIEAVQRYGAPGRKDSGFPSPSGKKKH